MKISFELSINTLKTISCFILIASLFSCIEQERSRSIIIKNNSPVEVDLYYTSSHRPDLDREIKIASKASFKHNYSEYNAEYNSADYTQGIFDTCRVVFSDSLQHIYFRSMNSTRNILSLSNYDTKEVSETRKLLILESTYTITEEDYNNAQPF